MPGFAAATYVGLSRVTEERHWLSDIVFGSALGVASGHAVAVTDRVRIGPGHVQGGAALELRWSRDSRARLSD